MNDWVSFADRLNEAIRRIDPTLKDVDISLATGISKQQVGKYRRGLNQNPERSTVVKLAEFLGVDPAWLLGADVPMVKDSTINAKWDGTLQRLKDDEGILLSTYRELNEDDRKFLQRQIELLRRERERGDA
jgi:transcriptional regulator with XRE-family HTH domain